MIVLALLLTPLLVWVLRSRWIVGLLASLSPEVVYFVDTSDSLVALTIDDGPDSTATDQILDVLESYDAQATFFLLTDRIPGNEAVVERMLEYGHELANHLIYDEPSILLSPDEFETQLEESHALLSDYAEISLFRPGSGWYNSEMLDTLREHDYRCVLGSVYPFDPQIPWMWFASNYVLINVHPGAIISLHDYGARGERTAQVLTRVLPELQRRGYRVVTMSELLEAEGEQ